MISDGYVSLWSKQISGSQTVVCVPLMPGGTQKATCCFRGMPCGGVVCKIKN